MHPTTNEPTNQPTAPRITPYDIEANIIHEIYFSGADPLRFAYLTEDLPSFEDRQDRNSVISSLSTRSYSGACLDIDARTFIPEPLKLLTFCVLILRNGFTVTGTSACASPEIFDAEKGRQIARANAINKVWPLMGYKLKSDLYEAAR